MYESDICLMWDQLTTVTRPKRKGESQGPSHRLTIPVLKNWKTRVRCANSVRMEDDIFKRMFASGINASRSPKQIGSPCARIDASGPRRISENDAPNSLLTPTKGIHDTGKVPLKTTRHVACVNSPVRPPMAPRRRSLLSRPIRTRISAFT